MIERLLFPIADIQLAWNQRNRTAAFGQERTWQCLRATAVSLSEWLIPLIDDCAEDVDPIFGINDIGMTYLALTVRNNPTAVTIAPTTEPMA